MTNKASDTPFLSKRSLALGLVCMLAVFLFLGNPIWRHPFDLDANIIWSYVPIPIVVAALLKWEKNLRGLSLVLSTIELASIKFALTYLFATLLWMNAGQPEPEPDTQAPSFPTVHVVKPKLRTPPSAREASSVVSGVVQDESGKPVVGAFVYIASGLDEYRFKTSSQVVQLRNNGKGFAPAMSVLQVGQPLVLQSLDQTLHTMLGRPIEAEQRFNYPVLASGEPRTVVFEQAFGVVELSCQVHAANHNETPAYVLVLNHRFATVTEANGAFSFSAVPRGPIQLKAWLPRLTGSNSVALNSAVQKVRIVMK